MNSTNTYPFNQLKKAVTSKFLEKHSAPHDIKDWNGDVIVLFQEDLFSEVKAKVSEKWFYTYFKNDVIKLPRIDMLNLLSRYVGYDNWHAFKNEHEGKTKAKLKKKFPWFIIFLPFFVIFMIQMNSKNEFQFCFEDDFNSIGITSIPIDIKILQDDQSPIYFKTDSLGCFSYETKKDRITFIASSPYHKTDTIVRSIDANKNQVVKLKSDDYALILKYYTSGNVKDWSNHKQKLKQLFHKDVEIYRFYEDNIGVEIYSKDDFIRFLTIPTATLKKIKILEKSYDNNKIKTLKFTVR